MVGGLNIAVVFDVVGCLEHLHVAEIQILHNQRVGGEHALEAVLLRSIDNERIPGAAAVFVDGLAVLIAEDRVGDHDGRSLAGSAVQIEAALDEGDKLDFHLILGDNGVFTGEVVVVAAALVGEVGKEVLELHGERLAAPAEIVAVRVIAGLVGRDNGVDQIGGQRGILGEGVGALRAGVGQQVDLRGERHRDADGAIQAGDVLRQLADSLDVKGRGLGKAGDLAGHGVGRVAVEHHRHAVLRALGQPLQHVGGGVDGLQRRAKGHGVNDEVAGTLIDDHGLHGVAVHVGERVRILAEGAEVAVKAQTVELLDAHTRYEILRALGVAQTPVLIGIQLAVLVEILEGEAVVLEDDDAAGGIVAKGGAAVLRDLDPAVGRGLLAVLRAVGEGRAAYAAEHHHEGEQQGKGFLHACHVCFLL